MLCSTEQDALRILPDVFTAVIHSQETNKNAPVVGWGSALCLQVSIFNWNSMNRH